MFSPQYKAYGHAFQVLPEIVTYRWAAVIDLDEFIVLDKREFATISDFVAAREVDRVDAIALNWLVFGSNGETRYTEELVTRRFVTRDPAVNRHVKSLCRPSSFVHNQCHYPIADDYTSWVFRDSSGDMHPKDRTGDAAAFSPTPGGECAWINHYLTKSAEEMILRRIYSNASFGWTAEPSGEHFESWMIEGFMRLHDAEKLIVDARAVGCVPALKAEIEKLYSIPGVENAMGKIALLQRKRIRQVDLVLQSDPRFQAAGSNEKWFAEVISEAARLSQ